MGSQSGVQGVFNVSAVGKTYGLVNAYNQSYNTVEAYFTDGTKGEVQIQVIGKDSDLNIVFNEVVEVKNTDSSTYKKDIPSNVMNVECFLREVLTAADGHFLVDIFND